MWSKGAGRGITEKSDQTVTNRLSEHVDGIELLYKLPKYDFPIPFIVFTSHSFRKFSSSPPKQFSGVQLGPGKPRYM